MIKRIKLLRNTGSFLSDNSAGNIDLKRLVLIHAENGRGKTTLTTILRSLATGNPELILERQRLGSNHAPHIVIVHEDFASDVQFRDGAWAEHVPHIQIFDDTFVNENVYSGLNVDSQHRRNLHQLILGERGVSLIQQHQSLAAKIEEHNRALARKSKRIPGSSLYGLHVDAFCALLQIPEIDANIQDVERTLAAAQRLDELDRLSNFKNLELPAFDVGRVQQISATGLPDLDRSAEARVQTHVRLLGAGGEAWVADGMKHAETSCDTCPFCGQDLNLSDLIAHYRAYFGEEYCELKQSITSEIESIELAHSAGQQTLFERSVRLMEQTREGWSQFHQIEPIIIDTETITDSWQSASDALTNALRDKQSSPLEPRELNEDTTRKLQEYERQRELIDGFNGYITIWNREIVAFLKQIDTVVIDEIESELNLLKATKERHGAAIAGLCADYLDEQRLKSRTERDRNTAREALTEYRNNVFPELQSGVNEYLRKFNAGYRIDGLQPRNTRSGSDCTYNLVINDIPAEVARNVTAPGEPSFRNTLSAGDRNTLALALYFSALENYPNLEDTVVVLDDPKSSLDDHRSLRTAQETRRLMYSARQVIVLSHDKRFLCEIWQGADRSETAALEISKTGNESSLTLWDVSNDAFTEYDRRHRAFRDYLANGTDNEREVARDLRLHLEGYFRVMFPDEFPPGTSLGERFVQRCQKRVGDGPRILDCAKLNDLRNILQYAHRFHHDTNAAWQSETINSEELRGFVNDVLDFVRP